MIEILMNKSVNPLLAFVICLRSNSISIDCCLM